MSYDDSAKKIASDVSEFKDHARERLASAGEKVKDDAQNISRTLSATATELAETASAKLRAVGVDTDQMAGAAREQAGELQRMLESEIRAHPLRALGFAALAGLAFGLLASR